MHAEEQNSTTPNRNPTFDEYKQIHENHQKMVKSIESPEDYIKALSSSVPMLGRDNPQCISYREWWGPSCIIKLPFLAKPYMIVFFKREEKESSIERYLEKMPLVWNSIHSG